MLALVEAAGLVGADDVLEAGVLDGILEGRFQLLTALGEAAWPGGGFVALVGADEEVMFEFRHWRFLLCLFAAPECGPPGFLRQYEIDATRQSYLA
jgi:hypothetical protein